MKVARMVSSTSISTCRGRPLPISVQGVLSLTQQGDRGGFQAVPSIFEEIDNWRDGQPPGSNPVKPDTRGREIVNVDMNPGDLVIFNSQLAHGVRLNASVGRSAWPSPSDYAAGSCSVWILGV
jgi:Phytanoyl-CoA dioxygenase (PhyH)